MYFKASFRTNPKTKIYEGYYRIVESYRNADSRVCHRTLLNVGFLEEKLTPEQLNAIGKSLTLMYEAKQTLFDSEDKQVKKWSTIYWNEMVALGKVDLSIYAKDSRQIDADTIVHKDVREVGSEWLCHNTWEKLKLNELLAEQGFSEQDISFAQTQILSRAIYPGSELASSKWIKENSAICEITGFPIEKVNKDRLYRGALKLYEIKEALEQHLSKRTNELFDIKDKILLYDLTNTYFEGEKRNSKLAKFGRSKEKRSDARLVVLALVVNSYGFIKYSSIHEGNFADSADLNKVIDQLDYLDRTSKPTVVIDAGIATEANLNMIRDKGYNYICVSRKKLKNYEIDQARSSVHVETKAKYQIVLKKLEHIEDQDYFLEVTSDKKGLKEKGMKERFEGRFEEALTKIQAALTKKGGTKTIDKVHQRIGRAKQRYPSVHSRYEIITTNDKANKNVISIEWKKNLQKDAQKEAGLGRYHLRTNMPIEDEETIWDIYNTIREVESTFRTLKTDLDLRPIYHKNDDSTMAHLHLGLLAYWIANTLRCQLKSKGINHSWREIIRIGNTQKVITTQGQNKAEYIVEVRKCSVPNKKLKLLYSALGIKQRPFGKQKSVVHKPKAKNSNHQQIRQLSSG